jgi:hypothetical protein
MPREGFQHPSGLKRLMLFHRSWLEGGVGGTARQMALVVVEQRPTKLLADIC